MSQERPPSVCIVRHDYYPDGHVSRDAEALVEAGYDVSVLALRRPGEPARQSLGGVSVYRLPIEHHRGSFWHYVWEYARFFALATAMVTLLHLRKRFRIVEVDNMPDVLVFAALIPRLTGARVILYIFDNMPELLVDARGYPPRHPLVGLLAWLQQLSARFADRVIVPHAFVKRLVQGRGTPESKLAVVLNCPSERIFDVGPPPPSTEPREAAAFDIVTHGAVLERFGIQVLIDALPRLAEAIPTVRLHVYGDGEYRPTLEERARRAGVADRVHFHGFVPQEALVAPLRRADVGYVGMLVDLMLSNKLMEYVALGIPAVVARWPTYVYYYPEDSVTYFPPGDVKALVAAIRAIHDDPGAAWRKAARAHERYQAYRWAVQRETYLGIYAELLALPAGWCPPSRVGAS
jgi:glycosyltransferase involved in cell wall biosynthesis